MVIKRGKTSSGTPVNESKTRNYKKTEERYRYRYRLLPLDIIHIGGVPYEYLGNGYIGGDTKWVK
ncbi:MAG: hypothetical protein H8D87_06375 [Deltaproteobacteria bacterium]|nr:hypothetical protein [Candidatus Desulfobacula maris]